MFRIPALLNFDGGFSAACDWITVILVLVVCSYFVSIANVHSNFVPVDSWASNLLASIYSTTQSSSESLPNFSWLFKPVLVLS